MTDRPEDTLPAASGELSRKSTDAAASTESFAHEGTRDELRNMIMTLNERLWEKRANWPIVEQWLENFAEGEDDDQLIQLHALFLLSRFVYFGDQQVRELLVALFRDIYRYPIVEQIRKGAGDTLDQRLVKNEFFLALTKTRFLGIGNPSESGTHLLYLFRQENGLGKSQFITADEVFKDIGGELALRTPLVNRYVFLDDFCGSGQQAKDRSKHLLPAIRAAAVRSGTTVRISYFSLVATVGGLRTVLDEAGFDDVESVLQLDETFRCFSPMSRLFRSAPSHVSRELAEDMAGYFGAQLSPSHPLGYDDGQLLIGFKHNTPDNTLPIIWSEGTAARDWAPVFRRYSKH